MTAIDYNYSPTEYPPTLTFPDGLFTKPGRRYRVAPTNVLVITGDRDTEGKKDYTGAFKPEAIAFCQLHGINPNHIEKIDVSKDMNARAKEFVSIVEDRRPQVIAIFCHGYSTGIQLGLRSPTVVHRQNRQPWVPSSFQTTMFKRFCSAMPTHNPVVVLYACSTGDDPDDDDDTAPGSGDDSFADLIRDQLCRNDARTCRVFSHTTAAHATRNPNIKIYDGNFSPDGGVGAASLARPGTTSFRKLTRALKTDFRFRVPFLTTTRTHELLESF